MQLLISIRLRRSFILLSLLCGAHGIALAALLFCPSSELIRAVILAAIVASLWYSSRPSKVRSLYLGRGGQLECGLPDGTRAPVALLPGSVVFFWLVVFRFRVEGEKRTISLSLFPDHMSSREFRLLRVWLRWSISSTGGDATAS